MDKIIISEEDLCTPVFSGTDEEIASAVGMWSGVVGSITYISSLQNEENVRNMLVALSAFIQGKLVNSAPPAPELAVPSYQPPPAPAAVAPNEVTISVQPDSYAESKITESKKVESPLIKRMRELAGIPHESNRV